jgi:proteasome assembly chaperone (PAC2) family protein
MSHDPLRILAEPLLDRPRMVLGFSGWMDGGDVSTGTVEYLAARLDAHPLAEIEPDEFYIYNIPGPVEFSALFRPYARIEDGLIAAFQAHKSVFFHCSAANLILFIGKEPNLRWPQYADGILALVRRFGVSAIYFVGSVGGTVPHTRQPRLFASVSDAALKETLAPYRVRMSTYEGPASFITYLMHRAADEPLPMIGLVAEIPAYVQGRNHCGISAVVRQLAALLNLSLDTSDLRPLEEHLEARVEKILHDHPELQKRIRRLETDYDNDIFDTEMTDLKSWLEQRKIRLD